MVWQRGAAWIPETSHILALAGPMAATYTSHMTSSRSTGQDPVIILSAQQCGMHTFVEVGVHVCTLACDFHILVSSLAGRDGRAGFTPDSLKRRFQGFTKRTENTPNV